MPLSYGHDNAFVHALPQTYLQQHAPFTDSLFQSLPTTSQTLPLFLSDLLRPTHSDPVPSVAGDPQRIHLHDSGTHSRKIPRRLHAPPLQVRVDGGVYIELEGRGIGEHIYSTFWAGQLGMKDKRGCHTYSWGKPHQRERSPTHTWCMTLDGQPLQSIVRNWRLWNGYACH